MPSAAADSPRLPEDLADALGEALFRVSSAEERRQAIEGLVLANPLHAAGLTAAAARWIEASTSDLTDPTLSRVGPFRVQSRLGRGGFGDVYLAEQDEPVRRRVALKVLKLGMDSESILRRFAREQQALARMNHEAIAKFYDAGVTDSGQPYFAMELVEGKSITAYCAEKGLALRERLKLFCEVCRGVQHAHQKGVLHRDLKPGNVLVADTGLGCQPKLIDFGIARALEEGDEDLTLTHSAAMLGTPLYMAPEQLSGDASLVDTRTDVHALGLLLFELLACAHPLHGMGARSRDPLAVREHLRLSDPARPSQRVAAGSAATAWQRELRGDLDWIVQKACAREPEQRYSSAAGLATDIERHLAFEPVSAGPPTTLYLVRKFVRRNRGEVLTVTLVLLTAIAGGIVALDYARVANQRANDNQTLLGVAETARKEAQKNADERAKKVREFEELKGVVLLREAKAAETALYPAWPSRLDAMNRWLIEHAEPIARLRQSARATMADLEQSCAPWSDADRAADAATDPLQQQWKVTSEVVASLRRARDVREGRAKVVIPDLPLEHLGLSAQELHVQAEARSALLLEARTQLGEELLGLRYAIAAADKARGTQSDAAMQVALAVAYFSIGLDADALRILDAMPASPDALDRQLSERLGTELRRTVHAKGSVLLEWERKLDHLTQFLGVRRTFRFPANAQAESFLHSTLLQFDRDVEAFQRDVVVGVQRRVRWAEFLRRREQDPEFLARAAAVRTALSNAEAYRGAAVDFANEDLVDLEPLGIDPVSGLFRFAHLRSAWDGESDPAAITVPQPDSTGRILVGKRTPIVFALLPGGAIRLGCQNEDPLAVRFDEGRRPDEALHSVQIDAFLMATHELTQDQWKGLWTFDEAGKQPSRYFTGCADFKAGTITGAHPVETVDFLSSERLLSSQGLRLPTEAQWEYACRAGTNTPRSCGLDELVHCANLADATARHCGVQWRCESWEDGFVVHAPVGTYAPNAFGLFDMHGNVSEWTADHYGEYGAEREGDGARSFFFYDLDRCHRGGSYQSAAESVRSAFREHLNQVSRNASIGLRPSRPLRIH